MTINDNHDPAKRKKYLVVTFYFTNSSRIRVDSVYHFIFPSGSAWGAGKVSVFDLKIFYLALLQARKLHDVKINTAVSAVSAPPFPLQRKLNEKIVGFSRCENLKVEPGRNVPMFGRTKWTWWSCWERTPWADGAMGHGGHGQYPEVFPA